MKTLSASVDAIKKSINKNTKAILLTHILGFNGLSDELLKIIKRKKIFLIEDVCESHGVIFRNKKAGCFGDISNFSFYYAHHMSTIEGGMVCTNNKKIYDTLRIIRSHGMLRESSDIIQKKKIENRYKYLNKDFIFLYPGFNFRSTEINAVYGINQLKRLDFNNKKRIKNFDLFISLLNKKKYFVDYDLKGSCNYAFVILFQKKFRNFKFRNNFENVLSKNKIEFRRGMSGGGNLSKQPFLSYFKNKFRVQKPLININIVHDYGYYIGNYPTLKE